MKPFTPAFNDVASPVDAGLRLTLLTALYWILLIDADERHEKEHRRVLDRQKASHEQQCRKHRPKPPLPGP